MKMETSKTLHTKGVDGMSETVYVPEVVNRNRLRQENVRVLDKAGVASNMAHGHILLRKSEDSQLDIATTHELLLRTILHDDTFKSRSNLEKLLTAAKFIDHEYQTESKQSKKFPEHAQRNSFLGQMFLVENGMMPSDVRVKITEMEARVSLTANKKLRLRGVKPLVLNTSKLFIARRVIHKGKVLRPYQHFQNKITSKELYQKDDPVINAVIRDLKYGEIHSARTQRHRWGSQMMLTVLFQNGAKALFKPQRYPPSQGTITNNYYFTDTERPEAEIAGFHLDRLLEFRRVPPSVGRHVNITKDILPYLSPEDQTMVFQSPSGNLCFTGRCRNYCSTKYAFCGHGDLLPGSFAQFVPEQGLHHFHYPWTRRNTLSGTKKKKKKKSSKYCPNNGKSIIKDTQLLLLDMIDTAIFDFLIDNSDRFLIDYMYSNQTSSVRLDQGRGFGHAFMDTILLLSPLTDCCLIRHSTLKRLLHFERGSPKLSDVMRESLSQDLLAPVLLEEHLLALDRRVKIVLRRVYSCLKLHDCHRNVVVDDGHVS